MDKSVKLFQPIEIVFPSFGIDPYGQKMKDRVSLKFFFFVACTSINCTAALAFFLFEGKSVADLGDSFYQASTMSVMTYHIINYCRISPAIHQLITQMEKFFEKSKF